MKASDWLLTSIMTARGGARGVPGRHHAIAEASQGDYHYVYGPYSTPGLEIEFGDVVRVETEDVFGGKITSEHDKPSKKLHHPFLNPQSGPIAIRGGEKGDCLAVHIRAVETRGAQPAGTASLIPGFGGLVGTGMTAMLNPPLSERVRKMRIDEAGVHWSDRLVLPYEPFIGTIGTSPEVEAISSVVPDYHGGNMDLPDVAPGCVIYLPVHVPGGRLFVGDCHATQGDGELSGIAVEQRAAFTLQVDLIKQWAFGWPRLETADFYHDDRQRVSHEGRRTHRLPRTRALDGGRLRLRRARRVHAAEPGRPGASRAHGGPEIHHRQLHPEEIPDCVTTTRLA